MTIAVAKRRGHDSRDERAPDAGAEVIDLIQLPSGSQPRPFASLDFEEVMGARALECESYDTCLSFAAHAKWKSFSCRICPKNRGDEREEREDLAAVIDLV